MKKSIVAVLMVLGMVSLAQAEVQNTSGKGNSAASACSNAKFKAKEWMGMNGKVVVKYDQCQCSPEGKEWVCSVDFIAEKQ